MSKFKEGLAIIKSNLTKELSGQVESVRSDPYEPEFNSWVDISDGKRISRLLVPNRIVQEEGLTKGDIFKWTVWKWELLNIFLNDIADITEDYPPSLDKLIRGS